MRWLKFALVLLVALIVGYVLLASQAYLRWRKNVDGVTATADQCYAGHTRYQAWRDKVVFPYQSSVPQSAWAERVRKLHTGQSTDEVLSVFGEPDYVGAGVSKEGDRFLGCYWTYEVRLPEETVNYKRNSWIEVFFDQAHGRVVDFDTVNIDGISNRPFPSPTRKLEEDTR